MARNVILAAALPATAETLFDMYLDAAVHAAFTGAPVTIDRQPGSPFSAFDGVLTGRMLHTEHGRLIVQTWRSANWTAEDRDSVLTLSFHDGADAGQIELVHVHVPESDFAGVSHGWETFYWQPWRRFLTE